MADQGNMSETYKPGLINPTRRALIRTLPAEHQDFFYNPDRFIVQNAGLVSGKGNKHLDRVNFIPQTLNTISVYAYTGEDPLDPYTRSCLHAYALSILYMSDWQDTPNPDYADMLDAVVSIISGYTYYKSLKESGIETVFKRCHIQLNVTEFETIQSVRDHTAEVREAVALEIGLDNFDQSPQTFTIIALSTLILIGKNVTDVNRDGWFRNRWRALANVSSVSIEVDRLEPPVLKNCQALYNISAANQPIRCFLFKTLRSLASIPDDETHVIFDRIIRLLQWAEMSHMWMIIDYVFGQHPDILNFPELRGPEISSISVAISFLKRFNYEDRAFLKLLLDHSELQPLHSQNFIHFTAAAHAIASLTRTSMLNINTRFSESVKAFQERVKAYIMNKGKVGPLAAAISYTTATSSSVRSALIGYIEEGTTHQEIPEFEDRQPEVRE